MTNDSAEANENLDSVASTSTSARALRRPLQLGQTLIAIAVVGALIGAWAIGHQRSSARSTISVTGSATVRGTPDTINFQIGVHTQNSAAALALSSNNQKVSALIKALESGGVKKRDIQTSNLNLYQNFNNNGSANGYAVDNSLSVTMHNISGAGVTIDQAIRAVGNGATLSGVTLSITNQNALLEKARTRAVSNARSTANQLARAAGTHVTSVISLVDQENQTPPVVFNSFKGVAGIAAPSVPVEAGSQTINVQVSVVFSLAS